MAWNRSIYRFRIILAEAPNNLPSWAFDKYYIWFADVTILPYFIFMMSSTCYSLKCLTILFNNDDY